VREDYLPPLLHLGSGDGGKGREKKILPLKAIPRADIVLTQTKTKGYGTTVTLNFFSAETPRPAKSRSGGGKPGGAIGRV
jgi:hypothetical protein